MHELASELASKLASALAVSSLQDRSAQYWPKEVGNSLQCGLYSVEMTVERKSEHYTYRDLLLVDTQVHTAPLVGVATGTCTVYTAPLVGVATGTCTVYTAPLVGVATGTVYILHHWWE